MDQIHERKPSPIGEEQLQEFTQTLLKYKSGKASLDARVQASERWWKLRNTVEEQKNTKIGSDGGFTSASGWLHNVIVSKHADAMEAYPEPNILPREENDQQEAVMLSAIIPCVLEQNRFEKTWSDVAWQKLKTGTGVYKVVWDSSKLNGLGDIAVERVDLLSLFWEPGISDIQNSRYFFHTELCHRDLLEERYPNCRDKINGNSFIASEFPHDDAVDTTDRVTVIEVYYRRDGKLHYCKYVGNVVLFATENDPEMRDRGLYDHGRYPFEFDPLFPIEGSPCGYGYVDLSRNPQTAIDLLETALVKNTMVGATPRYFSRGEGVNEEEFLDLTKPLVHVNSASEDTLRRIEHDTLDGNHLALYDRLISELRETSGNTETSTGNTGSGVTAASAIAALQEASGKGSRDSSQAAYRAYMGIVELCIELIRQFYTLPRKFRIIGQHGAERYVTYSSAGIRPVHQGMAGDQDMGFRMPVFDIKVSAQRQNAYTKVAQNELSLQFFQLGFFDPRMADQALMCLELMDFSGKEKVIRKVSQNRTVWQKLLQYMQLSLELARIVRPDMIAGISQDISKTTAMLGVTPSAGGSTRLAGIEGMGSAEPANVANARARAGEAAQPHGGRVIGGRGRK